MQSTYAGFQFYARDPAAALKRVQSEAAVTRDTAYYRANIGRVKTVDDLLNNPRLYTYALKSFGLEDAIPNRGFIRKVLTSDLTQAKSFANQQNDTRYRTLAAAFGFSTSGAVKTSAVAQDATQQTETLGLYSNRNLVGTTKAADAAYYKAHIANVHSVTDLTTDPRLYRIALQAYGLDPATTPVSTVTKLLESDEFDPGSAVDQSGPRSDAVQSRASVQATTSLYAATVGTDSASQAAAAAETAYYEAAMPDIHSVDAFLSDTRLVAYTATAYGLGGSSAAVRAYALKHGADAKVGVTAAQSSDLLRSILTSDLTQPGNFADTFGGGFRQLAGALGFGTSLLQSTSDTADAVARYTQATPTDTASQAAAATETAYYKAKIATFKDPAQLVADPRLMAYVTRAYGLTFPTGAKALSPAAAVTAALTGDPTDPAGAAAKLGPAFVTLASAFASAKPTYAQSAAAAESTIDLYGQRTADATQAAADTAYYRSAMPAVKSVDALLADSRLVAYVVKAYDIPVPAGASDADTQARLKAVLTSNPDDPAGAAALGGTATRRLASAFRFDAKGAVSAQPWPTPAAAAGVQSDAAALATADLYAERLGPNPGDQAKGRIEADYSRAVIAGAQSVDDVVGDRRVVDYLAKAYGIGLKTDATAASKASAIRSILTSDPTDPKSLASQQGNGARALAAAFSFTQSYQGDAAITRDARPDLAAFAAAFNFDGSGSVAAPRLAQSATAETTMLSLYGKAAAAAGASSTATQAEITYVQASIGKVRTLKGFLSDPRLVAVATTAYGVTRPPGLSDSDWTTRLALVLTSDLTKPKSAANMLGGGYRDLAAAFNFSADGTVAKTPAQSAQGAKSAVLLADPHAEQVMEDEAGSVNAGVKLALHFKQQAPNITSMFQILADKSLISVVKTSLGLPDSFSKLDIDAQARIIGAKIKRTDLTDPKKLNAFLERFAVRYDTAALTTTPPITPFDSMASGTQVTSNSLLATLQAGRTSTDPASVLTLFTQT